MDAKDLKAWKDRRDERLMEKVVIFGPEFDDFWTKTPLRSGLGGPWEHRLASGRHPDSAQRGW